MLGRLHAPSNHSSSKPSSWLLSFPVAATHSPALLLSSQQSSSSCLPSSAPPPHQGLAQARHRAGRRPWNSSSSSHRLKLVQAHPSQGHSACGISFIYLFSILFISFCQKFYYRGVKLIFLRRREIAHIHARISAGGRPLTRAEFRLIQTQKDDVNRSVSSTPSPVSISLPSSKE